MFPSLVIHEVKFYWGEGGEDILPWRGTVCPSVDCPGKHCILVYKSNRMNLKA